MSGEKEQQIFLKDWLVKQIDSGKYEGVEWLDKERKVFKIPWTHSKKTGYCLERDAALFREWAKYRGRYKGDNPKEASAWKINFRCALHGVKNVVELPELECTYPSSKVYQILPQDTANKKKKWPEFLPPIPSAPPMDPTVESTVSTSRKFDAIACTNGASAIVCSPEQSQMVTGSFVRSSEGDDSAYSSDTGKSCTDFVTCTCIKEQCR